MSDEWEIESSHSPRDAVTDLVSLGLTAMSDDTTYTIRNKETGERKTVSARDKEEVGRKIENGEID